MCAVEVRVEPVPRRVHPGRIGRPEGVTAPSLAAAARWSVLPLTLAVFAAGCGSSSSSTGSSTSTPSTQASSPTTATSSAASGLPAAGTATQVASVGGLTDSQDTYGIASDGTSVWIYNGDTGALTRVTAASGKVAATLQLHPGCVHGGGCGNLAVGEGAVWVANDVDGTITRVDPSTGRVAATIQMAKDALPQVDTTPGAVWSANYGSDAYARIDPRTNAVVATLDHHAGPEHVIDTAGSVWLCDAGASPALTRLDPASFAVQKQIDLSVGNQSAFCTDVAPLGSSLYVIPDAGATSVGPLVVDTATGQAKQAPAPGDASEERAVVGDATGTWALDAKQGVFRLDPATGRAVGLVQLAGLAGITVDGHDVWVVTGTGTLYRIVPG